MSSARERAATVLDVMADRLRIADAMEAANNSSAPMVALIFAIRQAGIDPEMPVERLARLVALGRAVERTTRWERPTESGVGWNTCLHAIYREAGVEP